MDTLVSRASDKTLGFTPGDVVGSYDDDGSHLMRIERLFMSGGVAWAEGPLVAGRGKDKIARWQVASLRSSGGIVAKWGFRVGDLVQVKNRKLVGVVLRLTSEKRCVVGEGDRSIDVHIDDVELIERDPLALEWMKQDQWNLGSRLGERTEERDA